MTNSTITTKISAAFLATVLVAGIIALSSPSFMVGAQAAPGYGMEKKYNSYEEPEYGTDSYAKKSYGSEPKYGMDSYDKKPSYGSEPEYGTDSYAKKAYGSNDYKSQYSSYGKDNSYKSKDSVSVKKVKCNNININLNGAGVGGNGDNGNGDNGNGDNGNGDNGNGDNGNDVAAASLSGNGDYSNGYGERKYVDKKDGFTFVCINNNNNVGAGGNVTNGDKNVTEACEECFDQLSGNVSAFLTAALLEGFEVDGLEVPPGTSIAELCVLLEGANISFTLSQVLEFIAEVFDDPTDADVDQIFELLLCLEALGIIDLEFDLPLPLPL